MNTPPYAVQVSNFLIAPWERSAFSLSQIGLVAADAGTFRWWGGGENLTASINGEALPRQRVVPGHLYEVDVSAYAGQEVELSFEFAKGSAYFFDVIGFIPIPEPSTAVLFGLGLGWLLLNAKRRGCREAPTE